MFKPTQFKLKADCLRIFGIFAVALFGLTLQAQSQCANPANPVVAENCLAGTDSSVWDINGQGTGDLTIQGFATDISVNVGGTIYFKINTPVSNYTIDIYRMGYYGGNGARHITSITPSVPLPQSQPACYSDTTTGLYDCGNWAVSASWTVPSTAVSGIYFAHLIRTDTGGDSHIVFVVRNDSSTSQILYQTSDTTWQAYNYYGNGSLYGANTDAFNLPYRSYKVSYNRPVITRGFQQEAATWVFGAEYAMVQWLEANGYDVSYSTALDADRNGALIKNHLVYMDSGHDEYVSAGARANVQAARDAGVNLAFFSGNEFFWKTRWENSYDGTNTPYRTLVCYKETLAFAKLDPEDPPTWTGTWRDPTYSPPADGGQPENALTGTLFMVNGTASDNQGDMTIEVPQADGQMRFWRNTAVASLAPNATYSLVQGSLGYEWDVDADNGFRPAGAFDLSTSTYNLTTDLLLDYGATYGAGTATHHMVMHRAQSGALIFSSGTIDWAYGLNSNHDNPFFSPNPDPDINMEQATVNLFADMGAQPATIQPGLQIATKSTDTTPPHSTILSPSGGTNVSTGTPVLVSGTASDTGGVVAGVEVSGDGGATWHPATGRANWSYSWTPSTTGTLTLLSRAVDDSGNLETPSGGVIVSSSPQTCPCTIFGNTTPINPDSGDGNSIEVGVKFRADSDGSIIGVRFYKSAANTGTHVGHIWTDSGQLLGTATFTAETASGWQQVNFSSPVTATANTDYVVSYFAPAGHYSGDSFAFQMAGVDNPPLHALQNGVDGGDGVFIYGQAGGFPTSTYNSANYWVDVIYSSSNTYAISGSISGPGGGGAVVSLTGTETLSTTADGSGNYAFDGLVTGSYTVSVSNPGVTFAPPSQAVSVNFAAVSGVDFVATVTNPLTISGTISGGAGATVILGGTTSMTTTADASGNYSFSGLLAGPYTITPSEPDYIFNPSTQAINLSGSNATGVNFQGQVCTCISIWQSTDTPTLVDSGDPGSVELGVRFTADSPAYLTGLRFYKASTNLGTHVGHLWSNTGQLLATATFPGETASGWQQGYFATPILISAGTPYVASYFAPQGHYSVSTEYFSGTGKNNPPLHALADGVSGPNGVYIYSTKGAFPTFSVNSDNYWVDVLYNAQPYTVSGTVAGANGPGATITLNGVTPVTTTADANGNFTFTGILAGTYNIIPSNTGAVFVPGNQVVTISQANITGVNFTEPQICPCDTVWGPTAAPTTADSQDPTAVEVGTKVRADSDGYVIGIRFYKAPTNLGIHIGNLWSNIDAASSSSSNGESSSGSATGNLLATATFVNEGASGWQQVMFSNPVPVVANTTYVASYFAPMGHYSGDSEFFENTGVNSPPLHALESGVDGQNGVFTYSASSTFPSSSFNSLNYWVDLIYATTGTYTIAGNISGPGAVGATVTLTGPTNATTTTDINGNYSFTGIANGSYSVTASESGFVYNPLPLAVTISGAHDLSANFVSTIYGFPVSGTVSGAPGITVTVAGATTQTAVADSNGNFSFTAIPNGTYTVTPAGPGYAVTPLNQSLTVNGTAVTGVNFTATVLYFTISGTITGGPGATVNLTGTLPMTTTADAFGNYTFTGVTVGTYTVTPQITSGVVFNPGSTTVVVNGANLLGINFIVPPNCPCDTIWPSSAQPAQIDSYDENSVEVGVKFSAAADAYITGLRFFKASTNTGTHIGHIWTDTGTLLGTATFTNETASGWQQVLFSSPIPVAANANYVASYFAPVGRYSADLSYFATSGVSSPPLQALENGVDGPNGVYVYTAAGAFPSLGSNNNAVNYWVDVIYSPSTTYSITGNISGAGGPGATVSLSGTATATTTADPSGNFTFSGLANGPYVVTPSETGFTYNPVSQTATINNAHSLGMTFSSIASYTLIGSISGPGGPGATVTLSGPSNATTTAGPTGAFSFPGLANGSYTVAVSQTGYTFTPASQLVTVTGANAAASFSSAAQTYSLSGTITGPGANGATITLSGTSSATTTSSSGAFSFTGLANGVYTVAVAETGFVYTPASQSVTVSGANAAVTLSSVAQTYTISGTISGPGGNGATVTLSGAVAATTTSSSGAFSFTGLANGSYTVAINQAGYVYSPASQAVTLNGANVALTVSSAAQTYTISGTISGAGANGAKVALSGTSSATTTSSSGAFSFTGLANGSYTVAISQTGYVYTPASQAVTVNGANAAITVSSAAQTYTISGTISGAGGNGATVTLSGAASATTTASATGTYSFTSLLAGSYTVTPSKAGYVMTPASTAVTITNANVTANFSSATQTFTLSGTISGAGGNGATVKLTGASTATITASSTGAYSFTGLLPGSYTVTPSKTGYVYSPVSTNVTITNANATANFTATTLYFIVGTISGAGGNGATVTLSGAASATVTASSTGAYTFPGLVPGSYTVTPVKAGYIMTPASTTVTISTGSLTVNFSSAAQTFTISGTISGAGGNGAIVKLTGTLAANVTASSSGTYSFPGLPAGSYTVTPSKTGYIYSPASKAITLTNANVTANFTPSPVYTIVGTISGAGGNAATVTLSGAASATTTASSGGVYSFTGLVAGSYTVTPSKSGYVMSPTSTVVTLTTSNVTANFTASPLYSISGTISGSGGNGATVKLTGAATATTTASSSGTYTFSGLKAGSYVVAPTKSGYTYTPASQAVTISTLNVTANFGSAKSAGSSCTQTPITPYIQVNGAAWQNVAGVTVSSPSTGVNLGPQPLNGTWSWTGPNGYKSTSRQINSIPLTVGTDTYIATYTNSSGCKSTEAFVITVQ